MKADPEIRTGEGFDFFNASELHETPPVQLNASALAVEPSVEPVASVAPVASVPVPVEEQAQPYHHFSSPVLRKVKKRGVALDLFSGTGSVSKRLIELGYEVVSLDINPKWGATFQMDLEAWNYTQYPPGHFKIIAASVPCAEYSIAKTTAPRDFEKADNLVRRVLEIIQYFEPKIWWIENPRTGHLKNRSMMRKLPFVDIDYCRFCNWGYQKPTRFWGSANLGKLEHKRCEGRKCPNVEVSPEGVRHREKLGGNAMKFSTAEKGMIPPTVIDYLLQEGEYDPKVRKGKRGIDVRKKGYRMQPELRQNYLRKLGVAPELVSIDLFASPLDAQEKLFMCEQNSAWSYNWAKLCGQGAILWANPPGKT